MYTPISSRSLSSMGQSIWPEIYHIWLPYTIYLWATCNFVLMKRWLQRVVLLTRFAGSVLLSRNIQFVTFFGCHFNTSTHRTLASYPGLRTRLVELLSYHTTALTKFTLFKSFYNYSRHFNIIHPKHYFRMGHLYGLVCYLESVGSDNCEL